jgi:hypothetical protein
MASAAKIFLPRSLIDLINFLVNLNEAKSAASIADNVVLSKATGNNSLKTSFDLC